MASKTPWVTTRSSTCMCPPFFDGVRCEIVTDATYVLSGGKDFVIIIIFALAILLSKFCFVLFYFVTAIIILKVKFEKTEHP